LYVVVESSIGCCDDSKLLGDGGVEYVVSDSKSLLSCGDLPFRCFGFGFSFRYLEFCGEVGATRLKTVIS